MSRPTGTRPRGVLAHLARRLCAPAGLAAAWLAVAPLVPALGLAPRVAEAAPARLTAPELDLKAAYLLGFMRYVRAADATGAPPARPITVGVLGDADFAAALRQACQGRHIDGRDIVVVSPGEADSLRRFDVVFVGPGAVSRLARVLEGLRGAPVLTVGEADDFVERGGIIELFLDERKLRFEINTDAAAKAGLRVSATLLSLAAGVRGHAH